MKPKRGLAAILGHTLFWAGLTQLAMAQIGGPGPRPSSPNLTLQALLNGTNEIPPNDSPLSAAARLTVGPVPNRPPPPPGQPGPQPTPLPGQATSVVSAGLSNQLTCIIAFSPEVLSNASGLLPNIAGLEDEFGNPFTNLVTYGRSPFTFYVGTLSDYQVVPVNGGFILDPEQIEDLLAGRWFLRVSAATAGGQDYPAGAIRGRILPRDADGDGAPDYRDYCPGTPAGEVVDTNGCSISQLCPCHWEWANHGDYVTAVGKTAASFEAQGLITSAERAGTVRQAAASDCGRRLTPEAPHSGITGQVFQIGPESSLAPFSTSLEIYSESGAFLKYITTEWQNDLQVSQFQVNLKPGTYLVAPYNRPSQPPFSFPYAPPFSVTVPFKQFTNVVILYGFAPP